MSEDPVLKAAYARGEALLAQRLREEGGSSTTEDVALQLSATPQEVITAVRKKRLVGFKVGQEFYYPRWQFMPTGQPYPMIEEMLPKLGGIMLMEFLLHRHLALPDGRRPLDLLRAGEDQLLRELASMAGEQVSW